MQWLVRLTKPPHGGVVLDQFVGSGRTAMACAREMRDFIGVEMDGDYFEIAETVTEAEYRIANQRLF
jgi:site-specific DNA-methyltransferase (adenine-specific)